MRIAAVILYLLLSAPVAVDIYLYADDHTRAKGFIRVNVYGVRYVADYHTEKDQDGKILLVFGKRRIPLRMNAERRKQASVFRIPLVKKDIRAWIGRIRVSLFVRLGTDNASSTALSCGLLRSVGAILPRTKAYIVPDYHRKCFSLAFHSITAFRLGRLFLTAILLAAASLWQKMSGGARNGNHQRAADKRCDANRA